ncbi:MAG: DUF2723 domain-containing protein [Gemmatimonadales bacterium]|nr:DUF2723 domain-containing protein [Gemmatimonadales bacterium]
MTDQLASSRPPYRAALGTALVVLLGYLVSLAPSVTFWDAGEFIATMKILGIPHPPGTPLYVMMGHVWGMIFPVGEFAYRTNLLSALWSAAGAACWFLVLHETAVRYLSDIDETSRARLSTAAAAAGAIIASFGFTHWLNSNETEVYAIATFTIAAVTWLLLRWRAARGTDRAVRYLFLICYLLGIAIGNHLLGLLAGPAVVAFVVAELRLHPSADPGIRRKEWGDAVLLAGLWALLTGIGLGNPKVIAVGLIVFVAALAYAAVKGELVTGLLMLGIALIGVTPYLYLFIRSAHHPMINEAAPATWDALLAVIRREQYEVRTPFDDPTVRHGPGNPGRSLTIIGLQVLNYLQYFDWQWAKTAVLGALPIRVAFTLAFLTLGLRGFYAQWRSDRSSAWMLLMLFLVTGPGLIAYMNFKPSFSLGYDKFPDVTQHEVRERDYFYVVSFIVWGLWAGLGLLTLVREWLPRVRGPLRRLAPAVFLFALMPFAFNYGEASRRRGPDARLAGDFAYDMLNSVPPYSILFTYGDNDTFPLWWAQEVEGVRRDVTVVCLALAETEWYMKQLRDNPVRPFEAAKAPAVWRESPATAPTWPAHTMTDAEIAAAIPQILDKAVDLQVGSYRTTLAANTVLYGKDFLVLRVLQQNFGRRPIAWALTATGTNFGLDRLQVQRGLAVYLDSVPPDSANRDIDFRGLMGAPMDIPATDRLAMETYRYADLLERPRATLESTASSISSTLGLPLTQLAYAMKERGDTAAMVRYLERAAKLSTNPAIGALLGELRGKQ